MYLRNVRVPYVPASQVEHSIAHCLIFLEVKWRVSVEEKRWQEAAVRKMKTILVIWAVIALCAAFPTEPEGDVDCNDPNPKLFSAVEAGDAESDRVKLLLSCKGVDVNARHGSELDIGGAIQLVIWPPKSRPKS